MFVRCFPTVLRNNLEMFCAVLVALHLHEHLGAFMEMLIVEDISPHARVPLNGALPLKVA